jgi:WD40 repeat protein
MSFALSADNSRIACGDSSGHIHILDFNDGTLITSWSVEERIGKKRWIWDVRYTKDGRNVISDGPSNTIAIWDALKGESVSLLAGHTHRIPVVVLSPDEKKIASGGVDGEVRIWSFPGGDILQVFKQRMDCSGLKIRGIKTDNREFVRFLVERGAVEE